MANTKKIISLIIEIVRHEVKKEVKKIFIKENVKGTSVKLQPKKFKKEVSYTKNPMLNKILNETAQSQEFEEYPTISGNPYTTERMTELIGYSGSPVGGDDEMRRKAAAIDTAQKAGVNPSEVPEDVMGALTRDYRDVMKAIDKKKSV